MGTHTERTSIALGVIVAAAVIGLAAAAPADAASRVSFGALVPAPAIYSIDTTVSVNACPIPDSNARMTIAYPTQSLEIVAAQSNHSNVQVMLDLDSRGDLLGARITNSSGNALLDQQALIAARGSQYAPEVRNCNSFKRSYYLDITFDNATFALPQAAGGVKGQLVK